MLIVHYGIMSLCVLIDLLLIRWLMFVVVVVVIVTAAGRQCNNIRSINEYLYHHRALGFISFSSVPIADLSFAFHRVNVVDVFIFSFWLVRKQRYIQCR